MRAHVLHALRSNLFYAKASLEDIPDDQMSFRPLGDMNPPAWIAGHIVHSYEDAAALLGGRNQLPEGWDALFGMGSEPTTDLSAYPTKARLVAALDDTHQRVDALLADVDEALLQQPTPDDAMRDFFPTVGDMVVAIVTFHEGVHLGQLAAWRSAVGSCRHFDVTVLQGGVAADGGILARLRSRVPRGGGGGPRTTLDAGERGHPARGAARRA